MVDTNTYQRVATDIAFQDGGFDISPTNPMDRNRGFYQFQRHPIPEELSGWKIHVSVDNADIPRATQIIADIYARHDAGVFKVAAPGTAAGFADPTNTQAGKIFTLYDTGRENWPQIMQDIEAEFQRSGIRPGLPVGEDTPVPGSQFSYRRNDRSPTGAYVPADEARAINPANPHNPYNVPDPLEGVRINADAVPRVAATVPGTQEPGTWRPAGHSLDEVSVMRDFQTSLGPNAVQDVNSVRDATTGRMMYEVDVPADFSRSEFARMGIDPATLRRQAIDGDTHRVVIPESALPAGTVRDAMFFRALETSGIPVSHAIRTGTPGNVTGYVVDVPPDFSRSNLAALGVDPNMIARDASLGTVHRLTIPSTAIDPAALALAADGTRATVRAADAVADALPGARVPSIRGGVLGAVVVGGVASVIALGGGATPAQAAEAGALAAADSAIPGVSDGFQGVQQGRLADRILDGLDTATGTVATGALIASAVPGAQPVSVPTAIVAGGANLGVNLMRDVTYLTGLGDRPGAISAVASALGDAHRQGEIILAVEAAIAADPSNPAAAELASLRAARDAIGVQIADHAERRRTGEQPQPYTNSYGVTLNGHNTVMRAMMFDQGVAQDTYRDAILAMARDNPGQIASIIAGRQPGADVAATPTVTPAGATTDAAAVTPTGADTTTPVVQQFGANIRAATDPVPGDTAAVTPAVTDADPALTEARRVAAVARPAATAGLAATA